VTVKSTDLNQFGHEEHREIRVERDYVRHYDRGWEHRYVAAPIVVEPYVRYVPASPDFSACVSVSQVPVA